MEYFYGGGGRSNPDFTYQFKVKSVPDVMWAWCEHHPLTGPFERWYVNHGKSNDINAKPIVQIESRKAAFLFAIAFSEYILENKSYRSLED